jgi:hypothetical protein
VDDPIVARIEREAGVPGLAEILARELAPTDLQSLLLAVARRRAEATTTADVLRRYRSDRFVGPSNSDPAQADELERAALALLPDAFERLDLSPVCPLGTSSALAGVSQDWVVGALRGGEVVSDPTNVLALECALRRRRERGRAVRLCTVHRVLRAQPFEKPFTQHFRLLALCSAGRSGAEDALLGEQLAFYETFLGGLGLGPVAVDTAPRKPAYYSGATFGVSVRGLEVVEGGFVDWAQRLLGDRKERLLVSGVGIELLTRIAPAGGDSGAPSGRV